MKKFFTILALAAVGISAMAEDSEEALYHVRTNSFWANWFVQGNYAFTFTGSTEEKADGATVDPEFGDRISHDFSVAVGKWFTPGLGLRAKFNGVKLAQIGETFINDDQRTVYNLHADALFNVTNMIWGYKENRIYNFIPYVGAGLVRNCSDDLYARSYNAGILNTFRLNKYLSVNLEGSFALCGNRTNGIDGGNVKGFKGEERVYSVELGLTWNISKTKNWRKAVDEDALRAEYDAQIAGLNDQLADAQSENARLKDELAKKPKEVIVKEVEKVGIAVPQSIFFNIGSAKITSDRETINLEAMANAAKANNDLKVYVTGYADSATGTPSFNQTLSEKRAETVAKKLESLGVSRDQMVVSGKGGVDETKKKAHNRRVIVEVK